MVRKCSYYTHMLYPRVLWIAKVSERLEHPNPQKSGFLTQGGGDASNAFRVLKTPPNPDFQVFEFSDVFRMIRKCPYYIRIFTLSHSFRDRSKVILLGQEMNFKKIPSKKNIFFFSIFFFKKKVEIFSIFF